MVKRVETFKKSYPIFDAFEKQGKLRRIPAEGGIEEIFGKVE